MADTKLADLTALTTPSGDDILYIVDDPAGTPLDRKIALDNLFTRGTITADAPVLNMSQTWNNAAVTFTGLKFNVTSTASNASSLLMDLGTGGGTFVSKFKVDRSGTVYAVNFFGNGASTANGFGLSSSQILVYTSNGTLVNVFDTNGLKTASTARFGFTNTGDPSGTTDTILTRRAAANLRLGDADAAAPVAQTLSVQSVVAGTTNIAGANLTITGSQGTGTGAGGSIIFQVAPAGSSGSAQNALVSALTISNETALSNLPALTFTGRYIDLPDLFPNIRISNTLSFSMSNGTTSATLASGRFQFSSPTYLGWSEDGSSNGTADVRLFRDAANTLAQRNGANAQTFNIYRSYTSASVHNKMSLRNTGVFWFLETSDNGTTGGDPLGVGSGYGGSPNSTLVVYGAPINFRSISGNTDTVWTMSTSGHFLAGTDNTYDIGTSSGSRPRDFFLARNFLAAGFVAGSYLRDFNNRFHIYSGSTDGTIVFYNQAETNFDRLAFGGTSASFPALKRSSTTLQAVLANDGGFTNIQGKLTTDTAYTATTIVPTGYLTLYDSTGTAYRVPCVV